MEQKKLFRTRLFGYKKSDVHSYLLTFSEKNQDKLNEQYDKQDALVKENHALKQQNEAYAARIADFEQRLKDFEEKKGLINNAILSAEKRANEVMDEALAEANKRKTDIETDIAHSAMILKKMNTEIKYLKENVMDSMHKYQKELDDFISVTDKEAKEAEKIQGEKTPETEE